MDVQLPDGRIIKGVPEGTSKSELMRRLGLMDANRAAMSDPSRMSNAELNAATESAQRKGDTQALTTLSREIKARMGTPTQAGGISDAMNAATETAGALTTGVLAEPLSGLAGLVQSLNPFASEGAGARAVESVRNAITYEPKTAAGRQTIASIAGSAPVQAIGSAMQSAEQAAGGAGFDVAGPVGGAAGATLPTAALEAATVGIGRLARRAGRLQEPAIVRTESGLTPSADFQAAMAREGMTIADIPESAVGRLTNTAGIRPEEALRAAEFDAGGIQTRTRGQITQDFGDIANEQRLAATTSSASEPVRRALKAQSGEYQAEVASIVDEITGEGRPTAPDASRVSAEAGQMMKDALTGRRRLLQAEKNRLYKEFAEADPNVQQIPLDVSSMRDAVPDQRLIDQIGRSVGKADARQLLDVLVRYGVVTDPDASARFLRGKTVTGASNQIEPLNVGNLDELRKELNNLSRKDQNGAMRAAVGPLVKALDSETEIIESALKSAGYEVEDIASLRQARATVRQIKTEFDPKGLVGKLVETKKNSAIPQIEASQAADKVLAKAAPVEELQRVITSLEAAGTDGQRAIRQLQAKVVLDALESTLTRSNTIDGVPVVTGRNFDRYFADKLGDDKFDALFKSNPQARSRIMLARRNGLRMSPTDKAVPKGSASANLDMFAWAQRVLNIPGLASVLRVLAAGAGRDVVQSQRAMRANPRAISLADDIAANYPTLAGVLGAGSARQEEKQSQ